MLLIIVWTEIDWVLSNLTLSPRELEKGKIPQYSAIKLSSTCIFLCSLDRSEKVLIIVLLAGEMIHGYKVAEYTQLSNPPQFSE